MKNEGVTAFPLCWPEGWQRTAPHRRGDGYQFKAGNPYRTAEGGQNVYVGKRMPTFEEARKRLAHELSLLKATGIVLSTDVPLRQDGNPSAGRATNREPGVAVYFSLKGKPMVMATDAYHTLVANMTSLALAIDAMRTLERHGGGQMMEKAFAGFTALPPPPDMTPRRPWWEVLRYSADPEERELISVKEVEARYQTLAKRLHPDVVGGKTEDMTELNLALEDAKADLAPAAEEEA